MRNYEYFDEYLNELDEDVYPQPEDIGHTDLADEVIDLWRVDFVDASSVLDVGCGTGFCSKFFEDLGMRYVGISLGESNYEPLTLTMDFTFTKFRDEQFDMIFARHALEHSPFPLLTLMEWHRVAKKYLILVLPNPDYYTYMGRNHYSVMNRQQSRWILRRAGWEILETYYDEESELRFLCKKRERKGFEGYLDKLNAKIYERDRDGE